MPEFILLLCELSL